MTSKISSVSIAVVEVICFAKMRVHKRMREVNGRIVYHERRISSITVRSKSGVSLRIVDDAVAVTGQSFGNDRPKLSLGGDVRSVTTVAVDREGDWDFEDMP